MTIWKVEHLNKVPEFSDLTTWLESSLVQNPNIIRLFDILDGPLLSIFILRAVIRTGNGELYYSALEVSLFTFFNGNVNYQLLMQFELFLISVAPGQVRDFIFQNIFQEKKTHSDSDSCAEGLDYRLEEENKKYKQYLHVQFPTYAN